MGDGRDGDRRELQPLIERMRVEPGTGAGLSTRDPADRLGIADKEAARPQHWRLLARLDELHDRLWAEASRSVLLVLQGMDAAGKDGAIRNTLTGLNPQGCVVVSFRAPGGTELAHDYLWRAHLAVPARGLLGVWNRSHYEDVVTTRVLDLVDDDQRDRRYGHIREFERLLHDEGTRIIKVFLHLSKDEQRERLQARLDDPRKHWKFRREDLDTRRRWDAFQAEYERAITATSTAWAPWHVVPADRKWVRDVAVASLLVAALTDLDPQIPPGDPAVEGLVVP